jgi:Ca2+-transporting ATPase
MPENTPEGLSREQAAARLLRDGPNALEVQQERTLLILLIEVLREPMFLLLIVAGGLYLVMGDLNEALILVGFVVIIIGVTVLQERRTEHTLRALRELSSPRALVIRDGRQQRIPGNAVVVDDILLLSEGDRVPADACVLSAHELAVDESLLSGESVPIEKMGSHEVVYAGTLVTRGQCVCRVTEVGARTALGKIGASLQEIDNEVSPLRAEMGRLTQRLAILGVALCIALAVLYFLLRGSGLDALLAGITLAMGILPQEFAVIMVVFFAMGARRIAQHGVLTRRLNAIETLGEATILCVDKTGTLTENRMTLAMVSVAGETLDLRSLRPTEVPEKYHSLLEFAVLASEIEPHDPMERAVLDAAQAHLTGTEHLHPQWQLAREYELTPDLLAMTHLWRRSEVQHDITAAKGAPEAIIDLCHLDADSAARVQQQAQSLAQKGLRVLGVAKGMHSRDQEWPTNQHDFDYEFLGLLGLEDPVRGDVEAAIRQCKEAGIRVVMITGDHPQTATAIAEQAGIDTSTIMTGDTLRLLDPGQSGEQVARTSVFARVSPQQKLQIVELLKAQHAVVAMTGDGVNDAPALKAAHIGIAMGKRGTDVAREAASLVLMDDTFPAIVEAIHLGRRIYTNLRHALVYTLAVHVPIIGLSIVPVLAGWPLILAPIHIAFLELAIDPACSIVFEAEKGDSDLMRKAPRPRGQVLLSPYYMVLGLVQGALITGASLGAYALALHRTENTDLAGTHAFLMLVVANVFLIFSLRTPRPGLRVMFSGLSQVTIMVLVITLLAVISVVTVPFLADLFGFHPLTFAQICIILLAGAGFLGPFQLSKIMLQRVAIFRLNL